MVLKLAALILFLAPAIQAQQIIGYIAAHDRLIQPGEVPATKLTRIQYAFIHPADGQCIATSTDATNLQTLIALKHQNPNLQVIASIGGGAHSQAFSDIALTPESRALFTTSCITLIQHFHLDGIDIDWEYPQSPRSDGSVRHEDKQNYTALLHDLRSALTTASPHQHFILSTATNGKRFFIRSVDLAEVAKYVDAIELMGYDFYGYHDTTTGNHSALFTNPADPIAASDDHYIADYIAAGVPASKIILGVPFYAHAWTNVPATNHGLFQPITTHSTDILYKDIPTTGFTRYWDSISAVPYAYNPTTQTFITFDDPESLTAKSDYVLTHHLAGIMFWSVEGDTDNTLLNAINNSLHPTKP